jgi:predicted RecA/RadA family phage recombinase
MAQNYIQEGDRLDLTSGGAVTVGSLVTVGQMVGVAITGASATGQPYTIALEGVFEVTKVTADVVAQGALLYRDGSNNRVTVTSTGNRAVGHAWTAAGNGATTVQVRLFQAPAGA